MNKYFVVALLITMGMVVATALPVTKQKKDKEEEESKSPATRDVATALEYERYLKEVVDALESDPEFRKKLDKAPEADIRSGKIAQELDYVNHHVRTKLDEIKRREVDRLRRLANKEFELSNDIDREHLKINSHLDHANEHTFEIEDLRKLIKKTSEDLAEADRKRRAEFKEYEMQKEFERESQLKEMNEDSRKKYEQELKERDTKHKQHEKLHHPGNKEQLEEVWEKQDHMDKADFNPQTFFTLHDVDGNGFWDETEVKALFIKELDKVYQSGLPEDDMRERAEEMERMREHVFLETDTNHDGLISFPEFLDQTKREEFNKDTAWETVDEQPQYTHEEYLEFQRRREEEIKRMVQQGLLPPHPNMPQGYYPHGGNDVHPGQQQQQPQMHYQQPHAQVQQQHQQYQQQQQQYQQYQQHQQQYQQYQQVPHQQPPQQHQQQYQQVPTQQQYQQVPHEQQQQQHNVQQQPQYHQQQQQQQPQQMQQPAQQVPQQQQQQQVQQPPPQVQQAQQQQQQQQPQQVNQQQQQHQPNAIPTDNKQPAAPAQSQPNIPAKH